MSNELAGPGDVRLRHEGRPCPVFAIKGTDALAYPMLKAYGDFCRQFGLHAQAGEVDKAAEEVRAWQFANVELTKLPDHKHREEGS